MRYFFSNFNNTVRSPLVTYPSLCSTCVTYGAPCHARGHRHFPPNSVYRECYGFERVFFTVRHFLPCTLSCCFQGSHGSGHFNLNVSTALCWSSKHSPDLTICLNHSNPQKVCTGRLYLRVRAGQLRNINLTEH